jgi:hypothetical protein
MVNSGLDLLSGQEFSMKSRDARITTCVTWSSVPPIVPVLIHLSAAIESAKGAPATGSELVKALVSLRTVRGGSYDFAAEEYKAVAAVYSRDGTHSRHPTLPRDIIGRIVERLLGEKDSVLMLAGHKGGVPLRAWLPTEMVQQIREFCKRRCSKSAFFITAATLYFSEQGIDISALG